MSLLGFFLASAGARETLGTYGEMVDSATRLLSDDAGRTVFRELSARTRTQTIRVPPNHGLEYALRLLDLLAALVVLESHRIRAGTATSGFVSAAQSYLRDQFTIGGGMVANDTLIGQAERGLAEIESGDVPDALAAAMRDREVQVWAELTDGVTARSGDDPSDDVELLFFGRDSKQPGWTLVFLALAREAQKRILNAQMSFLAPRLTPLREALLRIQPKLDAVLHDVRDPPGTATAIAATPAAPPRIDRLGTRSMVRIGQDRSIMEAVAREKGIDAATLAPLFDQIIQGGAPPDDLRTAIGAAIDAIFAHAMEPVVASDGGEDIDHTIADARSRLGDFDTGGALALLDEKIRREEDERRRRLAILLTEQAGIARFAYDFDQAERALRTLTTIDPDNTWHWIELGDLYAGSNALGQALDAFRQAFSLAKRLAAGDPGNSGLQHDLAVAHDRTGDVRLSRGNLTVALASFQAACTIREQLVAADPANAAWRHDLVLSHNRIGDVRYALGNLPAALRSFRAGLEVAAHLGRMEPDNATWQRALAGCHVKIGDLARSDDDLDAARDHYGAALTVWLGLAEAEPNDIEWQRELALAHERLGVVLRQRDELQPALTSFDEAAAIWELLYDTHPEVTDWETHLAAAREQAADLHALLQDRTGSDEVPDAVETPPPTEILDSVSETEAVAHVVPVPPTLSPPEPEPEPEPEAEWIVPPSQQQQPALSGAAHTTAEDELARVTALADADPGNLAWQNDLIAAHQKLGRIHQGDHDLPGALASCQAAFAIAERIAKAQPAESRWQYTMTVARDRVAEIQLAMGDQPAALRGYQSGLTIREKLAAAEPSNPDWRRAVTESNIAIGDVRQAMGGKQPALRNYQAALAVIEKLAATDPGNADWQHEHAVAHERIADVRSALGNRPAALMSYQAALSIREKLTELDPDGLAWQQELAFLHDKLGELRQSQQNLPSALSSYQASRAIRERLALARPNDLVLQRDLSVSHNKMGDVRLAQVNLSMALASFQLSLAIRKRLVALQPDNPLAKRDLALSYGRLGMVKVAGSEAGDALILFRDGHDIIADIAAADPSNQTYAQDLAWFSGRLEALDPNAPKNRSILFAVKSWMTGR